MTPSSPLAPYAACLNALRAAGRLRVPRAYGPASAGRVRLDGRELLDFGSNDYLGLAGHPALAEAAGRAAVSHGTGARASRLLRGNLELYQAVEEKLAAGKGSQAALVFASGFQANASVLAALFDRDVLGRAPLVFADRLNHASMHFGCRAAGVRQIRYRHLDLDHLTGLLEKNRDVVGPRFILSETVFSMDGDAADAERLADLAAESGAVLVLDEAHAVGPLGPGGFGLAAGLKRAGLELIVIGTFSKALGGVGAYAACSSVMRDYLFNRAAGLVFSTALPPPVLAAMDAALTLLPALDAERARLAANAAWLRQALRRAGLDVGRSETQIIPVILGAEETALAVSRALEAEGFLCPAVRPPTVPVGASRLRLSLTAAHSRQDVEALASALIRLAGQALGGEGQGTARPARAANEPARIAGQDEDRGARRGDGAEDAGEARR